MDILILHIIAVGCIIYLSFRYGRYHRDKELEREMEEFLKKVSKDIQKQPDPFFTRR